MIRAFVAIDLPAGIKQRLSELQSGVPGARWTDADGMHVTLRFIGEVPESALEDIHHALTQIAAAPFELEIHGIGQFGQRARTRVLWAGVGRSEALTHLRQKVESAVVRAGQPPEDRRFTPHVTVARLQSGANVERILRFVQQHALLRAGPFTVDRFVLFESRLGSGGAKYTPLAEYPLHA
ncbi:MAG TPA: RNA 2',3'-cyclic phosphodiesterase [Azospirillaceae bacterium]|nr:RNA 2',3'-cyclic phosphodiesterase [Azospirillaceae bacterium]